MATKANMDGKLHANDVIAAIAITLTAAGLGFIIAVR
jgi:ABC-type uncharacterized transport system permease subunit